MSRLADSTYSDSPGETTDSDDGAVTRAGSVDTRLADAAPAEPMSREEYANYMHQGPAADLGEDSGGEDGTGYSGESGDGDYSWTDPAVQDQGMTRSEYAAYMQQGPAAGGDDHDTFDDDDDPAGTGQPAGTGYEPRDDDPAAQDQGMTRSEYAACMRQEPWADEEDQSLTDAAHSGTDQVSDVVPSEADHPSAERPDIAARYPTDYVPASDPPPRTEGPHEQPEGWINEINPDRDAPGRDNNCGECSRAVNNTWDGEPAAAAAMSDPDAGGEPVDRMTAWAGQAPATASMSEIQQQLTDLGPGSSAIVGCDWKHGGGHWFNAVNDGGTVKAVDGQSGNVETWPPSAHGLGFDETDMRYSDAIFFTTDGQVAKR